MNKKENTNKSIKRMFLSLCMMTFVAAMSVENTNSMDQNSADEKTVNSIFGKTIASKIIKSDAKDEPIKERGMPLVARQSNTSNQIPSFDGSPSLGQKENTVAGDGSKILKSLDDGSDSKNDKNTIFGSLEDNSVTEIPKNISDIIGKINTAELCSREMLSLCSFICMEGYKAKRKNLNSKPIQDITASTVDALLKDNKDNSDTQIFKAALLSISLGVYHHNQAEKIFSEKINDPLIRISAIDRKNEFDNALSYFRINADPALINIKVYTDFVQYFIWYICAI